MPTNIYIYIWMCPGISSMRNGAADTLWFWMKSRQEFWSELFCLVSDIFALLYMHKSRYDFDETWGYRHASVVGETGTVCSWEHVMAGSNDMPTCITGTCGGHNEDDMLPFTVKVGPNVM